MASSPVTTGWAPFFVLFQFGVAFAFQDLRRRPPGLLHLLTAESKRALRGEVNLVSADLYPDEAEFFDAWWREEGSYRQSPILPANRTFKAAAPFFHQCAAHFADETARNCGVQGCGVVFVGDSITENLSGRNCYTGEDNGLDLNLSMVVPPAWRAHLIAGSGDQTQHALGHLARCLPHLKTPKLFVLMIGTNNLGLGRYTAEETVAGVQAVARILRQAHPAAKVLLHPMLPRLDLPELQDDIASANALLAAWQEPGVDHVDCTSAFPGHDASALIELMPDLLHPNEEGYKRWFRCLKPAIAGKLGASDVMLPP